MISPSLKDCSIFLIAYRSYPAQGLVDQWADVTIRKITARSPSVQMSYKKEKGLKKRNCPVSDGMQLISQKEQK